MHAKCGCQNPIIQRHGRRRRRCACCGCTWSIRKKRPGPKPGRTSPLLAERVIVDGLTFKQLGRALAISPQAVGRRFRVALRSLASAPLPPGGDLALLVDGLWFAFRRRYWVYYDMAVKPIMSETAYFLAPVLLPGVEHCRMWREALSTISADVSRRIQALVSDGFRGSRLLAEENGWLHQRCHFHLLSTLRSLLGRRPSYGGKAIRTGIDRIAREMLVTTEQQRLATLSAELKALAGTPGCPARLRGVARQFLREGDSFRTYLLHPELRLPTTISALESRHSLIRNLAGRVNNPAALRLWLHALNCLRPTSICNGHKNPQE